MGKLQTKEAECDYKKYNRKVREQFMHVLDDDGIIGGILGDVSVAGTLM